MSRSCACSVNHCFMLNCILIYVDKTRKYSYSCQFFTAWKALCHVTLGIHAFCLPPSTVWKTTKSCSVICCTAVQNTHGWRWCRSVVLRPQKPYKTCRIPVVEVEVSFYIHRNHTKHAEYPWLRLKCRFTSTETIQNMQNTHGWSWCWTCCFTSTETVQDVQNNRGWFGSVDM